MEGVKFNGLRISAGVWMFWTEGKPFKDLFPLKDGWVRSGVWGVVGGREIGSTLFSNGGALGLDVDPLDARSVLILGGRRGPDVPGKSHNVCLLSISRAADVVCGSSSGGVGRGKGDSAGCGVDIGGYLGMVKVRAGAGCVVFGGEPGGNSGIGGDGFGGKNVGALGFKGTLNGKEAVSGGGGWD